MINFLNKKLIQPLLNFLKQGVSPEKLALAIIFGIAFALIPVFGSCTALCLAAIFLLKLNLPAVLLINNFAYPLQFLFYIPFMKAGDWLFSSSYFQFTISEIFTMFKNDVWKAIQDLWWATMHGIVVWIIVMIPVSLLLYFILVPVFKKLLTKPS